MHPRQTRAARGGTALGLLSARSRALSRNTAGATLEAREGGTRAANRKSGGRHGGRGTKVTVVLVKKNKP